MALNLDGSSSSSPPGVAHDAPLGRPGNDPDAQVRTMSQQEPQILKYNIRTLSGWSHCSVNDDEGFVFIFIVFFKFWLFEKNKDRFNQIFQIKSDIHKPSLELVEERLAPVESGTEVTGCCFCPVSNRGALTV